MTAVGHHSWANVWPSGTPSPPVQIWSSRSVICMFAEKATARRSEPTRVRVSPRKIGPRANRSSTVIAAVAMDMDNHLPNERWRNHSMDVRDSLAEHPKVRPGCWADSQKLGGVEDSKRELERYPVFGLAQAESGQLLKTPQPVLHRVRMDTQASGGLLARCANVQVDAERVEECRAALAG